MTASPRIEDQKHYDPKTDFTCVDCGCWITNFVGVPDPKICCNCIYTPGWFMNERLRIIIDPSHNGKPYTPPDEQGASHAG